jgi:sensor c-di-GMP phosphodiesterase-like protein
MAARKRSSSTSLDAKQRALMEEQERLRKRIGDLQSKLEGIPKMRADAQRRRREELSRTVRGSRRNADTVPDPRHNVSTTAAPRRRRALKSERRQAQVTFLGLFFGLLLLLAWLYSIWR